MDFNEQGSNSSDGIVHEQAQETYSYKIIIDNNEFIRKTASSLTEKGNANASVVPVSCASLFLQEMKKNKNEATDFSLNIKNARLYQNKQKDKTKYFKAHGYCNVCKINYSITINNKPDLNDQYISVDIERHGKHEHSSQIKQNKSKKQIRGEARQNLIKDIGNKEFSAKDYRHEMIADGMALENAPSEAVLRRINYESKHQNDISKDWKMNLLATTKTSYIQHENKYASGFVQKVNLEQNFCMIQHMVEQLECVKCINAEDRILALDATGKLVHIPKEGNQKKRPKVLTYAMILKKWQNCENEDPGIVISEMHTTRHDVYQIRDFILFFKAQYESRYKETLRFGLASADYSYAVMHGLLQGLNFETIIQYAHRVYKLSTNTMTTEDVVENKKKTWFISCASHTMHRFAKSTNKIFSNTKSKCFAKLCFSLLLNCNELYAMKKIFCLICTVFMSKKQTKQAENAVNTINSLLKDRSRKNLKKKLNKELPYLLNEEHEEENDGEEKEYDDANEDDEEEKKSIKDLSPFTAPFAEIVATVKDTVNKNESSDEWPENGMFNEDFIRFLMEQYMPYCFLWAGFVMQTIGTSSTDKPTRITNGTVERFFRSRKHIIKTSKLPADYVHATFKSTKGAAIEFKAKANQNKNDPNHVLTSNDIDDEDDDSDSDDTENYMICTENWCKKDKVPMGLKNEGFYQKNQDEKFLQQLQRTTTSANKTVLTSPSKKKSITSRKKKEMTQDEQIRNEEEKRKASENLTKFFEELHFDDFPDTQIYEYLDQINNSFQESQATSVNVITNKLVDYDDSNLHTTIASVNNDDVEEENNLQNNANSNYLLQPDSHNSNEAVAVAQQSSFVNLNIKPKEIESLNTQQFSVVKYGEKCSENDQLIYVYVFPNFKISYCDFDKLINEKKLNDKLIEAYISLLFDDNYLILPYITCTQVFLNGIFRHLRKQSFNDIKYIVAPLYLEEMQHWALIFVSLVDNIVMYLDSCGEKDSIQKKIFDNWCLFSKTKSELCEKPWNLKNLKHAQQTDGINCGVFVTMFCKELQQNINKLPSLSEIIVKATETDLKLHRQQIQSLFEENSIPSNEFCAKCGHIEIKRRKQIDWLQCDSCNRWYHCKCICISNIKDIDSYTCTFCKNY